ncbi:glycosyltransferase family 2 protein [Streptococcus hillyeri]|uniref:Glycosyltransferase family 2 protein n=1 Tax=Streptococcus hillyeri TaxID=2282420 RepID=A0A3L9E137_9STRE|nr:glycosyltransferase [Streptococcus hillyeri]RLY05132.1 glycosyltransferase family 2 protein [Streptococcus hillyeri]
MKVSIICTNYNKDQWIGQAIDSFIQQETTFPYEIILIDDASTDCSREILEQYEKKYPELIRVFYNESNFGIAKTWKKIVKEARGEYIARCDGDDFWTDSLKLQKQVELLESREDSLWANSEFDMIAEDGTLLQKDVFKNGILPLADSYEHLLVYKLMTMASTWLVERQLMLEVTDALAENAADDTFDLQLELFKRTKLSTLEDSTTVYRMNIGSDSKPITYEKFEKRVAGICQTQLNYLKKYPDYDVSRLVNMLIEKDKQSDLEQFKRDQEISRLNILVDQLQTISANQNAYIEQLKESNVGLEVTIAEKEHQISHITTEYERVITSRRWTIPTKIINFFRRNK